MKFEISPFASNEEKLLEINETLESIKDVLAELVFDPKSRVISTQIIRRQEPQAFPGTAGLVP